MNNQIELYITQLISFSGVARSNYIRAIDAYNKHDGSYEKFMADAEENFQLAHEAHFNLIQHNPTEKTEFLMFLMHAEDQMMCAETFKIIAERINLLIK